MPDFNSVLAGPGGMSFATATVGAIDLRAPSAGTITGMTPRHASSFADRDLAPLLQSGRDILVFVHGCANSFHDAITRGAYNKSWLAAARLPAGSADFDVIVFTWPSRAYCIANIPGDYEDYRQDQAAARASAADFNRFLNEIRRIRGLLGGGSRRRINLLCHSMGNYLLAGAVAALAPPAPEPLFDEVVLAAADEAATSFGNAPPGVANPARLARLASLGRAITVYYNNDDVAMALSHVVNADYRLGYDGPPNEADTGVFPRMIYDFVDCTGVDDYISSWIEAPDRSHQYYRNSPAVRADIARILGGFAPDRPRYDATGNFFSLFPGKTATATPAISALNRR